MNHYRRAETTEAAIKRAEEYDNLPSKGGSALMEQAWCRIKRQPPYLMLRASFESGAFPQLVVLGQNNPFAKTQFLEDGSALIRITDGMIFFIRAVCQSLFSLMNWRGQRAKVTEAAKKTLPEATASLLATYDQWKQILLREDAEYPAAVLGEHAEDMAHKTFEWALLFLVMHELAHAKYHRGRDHDISTEREADWHGMKYLYQLSRAPGEEDFAIAGAAVAIRSFAALDLLGTQFSAKNYPPPLERFSSVLQSFAEALPSQLVFYILTTKAFTTDSAMQAVEQLLAPADVQAGMPRQIVSTWTALLIDMVWRNKLSIEEAAKIAERVRRQLGVSLAACDALASQVFVPEAVTNEEDYRLIRGFESLRKAISVEAALLDGIVHS